MNLTERHNAIWVVATSYLVAMQLLVSLTVHRGFFLTAFGDITRCVLLAVACYCTASNIPSSRGRGRLFWTLISLGIASWFLVEVLWAFFEVFLNQEVPNPFSGDVLLFLHLVPMMAALAVRPHRSAEQGSTQVGTIDFILLISWWLYLYMFVVIPWQYVSPNTDLYGRNFDVLYFFGHAALVTGAALVWRDSKGPWRRVYGELLVACILYASISIAASVAIDFGGYYSGSLYDVPLLFSVLWFARLGLVGKALSNQLQGQPEPCSERSHWIARLAMTAALSLPILAAIALYSGHAPARVRNFRLGLTLAAIAGIGALRSLRQSRLDRALTLAHTELREDSLTDLLTGARNRRFFASTIEADVQQALRSYSKEARAEDHHNRDLVFYLIDADHFKQVNDRYGHDFGDKVIVETAKRISTAIRHSDVLIRWGGDEFLVVSRYTDRREASTLAERVLEAVGTEVFEIHGTKLRRSCSVGWAVFPWHCNCPEQVAYAEVLRLADSALYKAKSEGKNRAIGMVPAPSLHDSGENGTGSLRDTLGSVEIVSYGPQPTRTEIHPASLLAKPASTSR